MKTDDLKRRVDGNESKKICVLVWNKSYEYFITRRVDSERYRHLL